MICHSTFGLPSSTKPNTFGQSRKFSNKIQTTCALSSNQDSKRLNSSPRLRTQPSSLGFQLKLATSRRTTSAPSGTSVQFRTNHIVHSIETIDHSYQAHRAVLTWMTTNRITFAQLEASTTSTSPLESDATPAYTFPPPPAVSPTDAYHLAHLLDLSQLQFLDMVDHYSKFAVTNAAAQLYSPASAEYDEPRLTTVKFVVDNWQAVRELVDWKEKTARLAASEMDGREIVSSALA